MACAESLNGVRSEAAEQLVRNNVKEEGRARDEAALHDQDDAEGFFEPGRAAAFGNALSANFGWKRNLWLLSSWANHP